MNKIYQKMIPGEENRSKSILSGFTLIELLVVVLIIGILAAVAVPQYEKAVEKSRAAEAKVVLRQIAVAQDAYMLSNGSATDDFSELDVTIPESGYWEYWLEETIGPGTYALTASRKGRDYFIFYTRGYGNDDGYFLCSSSDGLGDCKFFGREKDLYNMAASGWTVLRM